MVAVLVYKCSNLITRRSEPCDTNPEVEPKIFKLLQILKLSLWASKFCFMVHTFIQTFPGFADYRIATHFCKTRVGHQGCRSLNPTFKIGSTWNDFKQNLSCLHRFQSFAFTSLHKFCDCHTTVPGDLRRAISKSINQDFFYFLCGWNVQRAECTDAIGCCLLLARLAVFYDKFEKVLIVSGLGK